MTTLLERIKWEDAMKKILFILSVMLFLAGCGNEVYDKAMDQAKLAIANGEFDKAMSSLELALDEKPNDEEAKQSYEQLVSLSKVEEATEKGNWEEAITIINELLEDKELPTSIEGQLKEYRKTAEVGLEHDKLVSEKMKEIKELIEKKKFSEAQDAIKEIREDESLKTELMRVSEELTELEKEVSEEITKQKEQEEAEKARIEKEQAEAAKKEQTSWSTYVNERFGYSVQYPKNWELGPEPTNGDGRPLHQGYDAEISTFAYYYMEETAPDLSQYRMFNTKAGNSAFLLVNDNGSEVSYDGVVTDQNIVFHLSGNMSSEFYQENVDTLKQMLMAVKLN